MINVNTLKTYLASHQAVVERLADTIGEGIQKTSHLLIDSLKKGGKVVVFGNGGSATQASHLAGELTGRFSGERRSLPAISLVSDPGSVTCISNDYGYAAVFERQVNALVKPEDVVIGLTTSGRSENVLNGLSAAIKKGAYTIALTGENGLVNVKPDYVLTAPSYSTNLIQEVHLIIIHFWCRQIDDAFVEQV